MHERLYQTRASIPTRLNAKISKHHTPSAHALDDEIAARAIPRCLKSPEFWVWVPDSCVRVPDWSKSRREDIFTKISSFRARILHRSKIPRQFTTFPLWLKLFSFSCSLPVPAKYVPWVCKICELACHEYTRHMSRHSSLSDMSMLYECVCIHVSVSGFEVHVQY
jgi:hypothetical protein